MSAAGPVLLREGVVIEDPLSVALGLLEAYGGLGVGGPPRTAPFGEADLRQANRGGARISASEISAVLARRRAIDRALQAIAPAASLGAAPRAVPWRPLVDLVDAFEGIRGIGLSKVTKTLHPRRPALIPILDSFVRRYLQDDDLGPKAPLGTRVLGLVRGYKRDLDRNRGPLRAVRRGLSTRGYELTEVRALDLLIWSVEAL
jgi:hypothetical protein